MFLLYHGSQSYIWTQWSTDLKGLKVLMFWDILPITACWQNWIFVVFWPPFFKMNAVLLSTLLTVNLPVFTESFITATCYLWDCILSCLLIFLFTVAKSLSQTLNEWLLNGNQWKMFRNCPLDANVNKKKKTCNRVFLILSCANIWDKEQLSNYCWR
jgi:hypothetical protein